MDMEKRKEGGETMSLRFEQYNALLMSKEFMRSLLDPKATPRIPRGIRETAYRCLRHYPFLEENGRPRFSRDSFSMQGGKGWL